MISTSAQTCVSGRFMGNGLSQNAGQFPNPPDGNRSLASQYASTAANPASQADRIMPPTIIPRDEYELMLKYPLSVENGSLFTPIPTNLAKSGQTPGDAYHLALVPEMPVEFTIPEVLILA